MAPSPSAYLDRLRRLLCCPPPSQVTGVEAQTGGGSGEVFVAWNHNPPSEHIAFYRVYRRVGTGVWRHLAAVTEQATDVNFPGKVAMLDFEGNFPGGSDFGPSGAHLRRHGHQPRRPRGAGLRPSGGDPALAARASRRAPLASPINRSRSGIPCGTDMDGAWTGPPTRVRRPAG